MFPLPKWQKCLIGHSLRNSAHSSVHARRWHFCHLGPRPARILVHSVMNGRGIWFLCRSVRCAPPTPELVMHPCSHRPTSVGVLFQSVAKQGSGIRLRFNARVRGGRSVPLVGASRYYSFAAFGGGRAPAAVRRAGVAIGFVLPVRRTMRCALSNGLSGAGWGFISPCPAGAPFGSTAFPPRALMGRACGRAGFR